MNESSFRFVHLCLLIISLASNKMSFRSLHLNWLLLMCWNSNPAYWNWRLLSSTCYIVQDAACLNHKREEKGRGNEKGKMERGYCVILHLPPLCFIPIWCDHSSYWAVLCCGTIYHLYNVQNGSNMSIYKWSHQV